ncbi:exocyst complex component 5 [Aspergillus brasiliensis]|nr:exocyst complex component 5 [Aspergillus brasiliensis]
MLLQVAGLRESSDLTKPTDIKLTEEDGIPSISSAKRMLKWLAEAVGRGLELSVNSETPKDMLALLTLLLSVMGEGFIEVSLDAALEAATSQESGRVEPDFAYLPAIRNAIGIANLMVMCINTLLIPLAAGSITIRREMEKKTNLITMRIEEKINILEQKVIDTTLTWTGKLLSGQKKNDFRPKEGDSTAWLEKLQTPTCAAICTFLTRVQNVVKTSLPPSGSNIRQLLTEIAIGTRTLLLDHFKRFVVNGPGGLMVTKDMTQYTNLLKSWDIEEQVKGPSGTLDVLLEVGNLFVIGSEALRERIRGGTGSGGGSAGNNTGTNPGRSLGASGQTETGLSVQEVRAYVSRREDSNTAALQSVLNVL